MDNDFKEEVERMIKEGYMTEDLAPLKCYHCDSKNLVRGNSYYDSDIHMTVEYAVDCGDCGKQAGYWAYGGWTL